MGHERGRGRLASTRGDLLIDAIVGMALLGLAAATIVPLFKSTGIAREASMRHAEAANLADTVLEDVQALPFGSVTPGGAETALAGAGYPGIGEPEAGGWEVSRDGTTYDISLEVGDLLDTAGHVREVVVEVMWDGGGELTRAASVTDSLTSAPPSKPAAGSWITEFPFPASENKWSADIALGPDGNLWFTQTPEDTVSKMTTTGEVTQYPVPTSGAAPRGITEGPDGNMWFAESEADQIGKITTSGQITEYELPSASDYPMDIVAGSDGNLWFVELHSDRVCKITTSGQATCYQIPTPKATPERITAGPDGNLWFSELGGNKIGKITTSGQITEYDLGEQYINPVGITPGPDGNMWFTEFGANKIGKITPSGEITKFPLSSPPRYPFEIVGAPDGNLWFTEYVEKKIGRITPAGEITEFPVPNGGRPAGITVGPEGHIWFTQLESTRIGRINVGS